MHLYGSRYGNLFSVRIAQKVTEVRFMYNTFNDYLRDIWFTLADGSTAKTCNCITSVCNQQKKISLTANQSLVGLAFRNIYPQTFYL